MADVVIFAYGSLMYEPELPREVVARHPARLDGWHRWFDKRSRTRGCPNRFAPPVPAVPGFEGGGERQSLVLGTRRGGHIDGIAFVYPSRVRESLLQRLMLREGPGYRAQAVDVTVQGRTVRAATWLTNPTSPLLVDLDLPEQARVLAAATPTRNVDGRARGARYLTGVLSVLDDMQVWDPRMEALGELLRRTVDRAGPIGYP